MFSFSITLIIIIFFFSGTDAAWNSPSFSIRIPDPGVVRRAGFCADEEVMLGERGLGRHQVVVFGVMAHVEILTRAGWWSGTITHPRLEAFDVAQSCWRLDPFDGFRDCDDVHVAHGNLVLKELVHSCEYKTHAQKVSPLT